MNNARTLARPYAKAIFGLAKESRTFEAWSRALSFLAHMAEDPLLQKAYINPEFNAESLSRIFIDVLKKKNMLNQDVENFILLLAHYKRLPILPLIAGIYEEDRAEFEKQVQVSVTSAFKMSDKFCAQFKMALEKRLERKVDVEFSENKSLIGGAIVRMGDKVIDRSVKSLLEKLRNNLCL